MIKIQFWLKKSTTDPGNLEYVTISEPKIDKNVKSDWGNLYICEVYLSVTEMKIHPIYGINPIQTINLASGFIKTYCQALLKRGYTISEIETKERWKLEKLSDNFLQEEFYKIKNDKSISPSDKKKILSIIKESFGAPDSPIKDQVNKLID